MFSATLFSGLSGGEGIQHISAKSVRSAGKFRALFPALIACILTIPVSGTAFGAGKSAKDTGSAEGLLSSTEQMIEHLKIGRAHV
mgnify:CR=1 FL=1